MSAREPHAATDDRCYGLEGKLSGKHRWRRVYRGATLDAWRCLSIGCGATKTTEGTALRGR